MAQERKCQVIKIENVTVSGWEAAIRGMRNPMNSWIETLPYSEVITGERDAQAPEAD